MQHHHHLGTKQFCHKELCAQTCRPSFMVSSQLWATIILSAKCKSVLFWKYYKWHHKVSKKFGISLHILQLTAIGLSCSPGWWKGSWWLLYECYQLAWCCLRLLRGILGRNGTPELPFLSCCRSEEMGLGSLSLGLKEVTHRVAVFSLPSWVSQISFRTCPMIISCFISWTHSHSSASVQLWMEKQSWWLTFAVYPSPCLCSHEFTFFFLFAMSSYIYLSLLWLWMKFSLCWFTLMPVLKLKNMGQDIFCL